MELKEFVATTLTAIVEGLADAQKQVIGHGANINPGRLMRGRESQTDSPIWDNRNNNYARTISFDIALTIEDGTSTNAKVSVVAGLFNLGAGGSSDNKQVAVSRVQFAVPVLFPASDLPVEARQTRRE